MTRDRQPIRPQEGLNLAEFDVPARDGSPAVIRSYRQSRFSHATAVLVYMHGGGYVTGSLETDDASCRAVAMAVEITILSIEYRLAPEYKFPVGFQDCMDVIRAVRLQLFGIQLLNPTGRLWERHYSKLQC